MIAADRGRLGTVDPRVKIVWILATMVAGLLFVEFSSLIAILLSIVAVAWIGGVLGETFRRLKGLAMIIVVIGLIFGLTVPGEPLFALIPRQVPVAGGQLMISREGLMLGIVSIFRMFIFAAPLLVVIMTTNNSDLLQALMFFRLPMEYALMIVLALNFIPVVLLEFGRVADAQKARAHSLMDQGVVGKMRGLVPIFIPLTLNAVDRADTIGKVLEMRGITHRRMKPEFEALGTGSWTLLTVSVVLTMATLVSYTAGQDLVAAMLNALLPRF
ncbi:MAG TPA: hypothetical protein DEP84_29680 [Chloroflexi bacterium]|nr:hypothetical protein [Chloroflexota bacterium]